MENKSLSFTVAVLLSVVMLTLVVPFPVIGTDSGGYANETVVDSDGVVYEVSFSESDSKVIVNVDNRGGREGEHTGYSIQVDGQRVYDADFRLDQGEQRTQEINVTPGINVNRDEHTVTFSTYGNSTQFNFTREINSTDPGKVPTPYISNVEVADGTIDGEPSAVAIVTLVNPSEQLYSTKLFVHTTGTDGSLYPASVRPGESRTITVELLDERGSKIAGEARLYTGNMTTEEGAMNQVEFAGQAGAETQVWNTSYEPAKPTWMDDHYRYHNDSYEQGIAEKVSGGQEVEGVPVIYLLAALVVGVVVVRKFR